MLLGQYLGVRPATIQVNYGSKGKPTLGETGAVEFNASHSDGLAVFAFTFDCEIGIDVEQIRSLPDMQQIANRFFCAEEATELMLLPESERQRAFFRCWTRKEAYIKTTGEGLSTPLDGFRVTLQPEVPARLVHVQHDLSAANRWTLHDLELTPAYAGALAYCEAPRPVLLFPIIEPARLC
jgi:4'-phosphopantetheinyl transferase